MLLSVGPGTLRTLLWAAWANNSFCLRPTQQLKPSSQLSGQIEQIPGVLEAWGKDFPLFLTHSGGSQSCTTLLILFLLHGLPQSRAYV